MAYIDNREIAIEITKRYGEFVKEQMDVKYIYLYGSYAKGNYELDSDIDIAVVGDGFTGDTIEDTLMLMKIRRKVDTRIEPRPFNVKDFNLSNPIAKEIMDSGILITEVS